MKKVAGVFKNQLGEEVGRSREWRFREQKTHVVDKHDKKVLTFNHNFILTTQFGLTLTTLTLFIVGFRTITSTHTKRARVMCD